MSALDRSPSIAPPRRRKWVPRVVVAGVTALAVGGIGAAVVSSPAAAATVDTSAWYVLLNRNSGKVLDVNGAATTDGAAVIQWTWSGSANQQWRLNSDGTITGVQSGLCLDVSGASTANGATTQLWTCNGQTNQKWTRS